MKLYSRFCLSPGENKTLREGWEVVACHRRSDVLIYLNEYRKTLIMSVGVVSFSRYSSHLIFINSFELVYFSTFLYFVLQSNKTNIQIDSDL